MRRKLLWASLLGCVLAALGLAALISMGGEPAGAPAPAPDRSARDYFPRNPLVYVTLSGLDQFEARLAALKLWKDAATGKKEAARLAGLAARQLALLADQDDPEYGRKLIAQVKALHVALYPPVSEPPEFLIAVETADAAEFLKLLAGPAGAKPLGAHRGAELVRLPFSLSGSKRRAAAVAVGKVALISPYAARLRQALDLAASGRGALGDSPGFADCRKRFSDRPLWGYVNVEGLTSVGMLDEYMVRDVQEPLVALGLPSYRWAGFGSSLGQAPVALEFHLEFHDWCPLGSLGALARPPDESLAKAVPADAIFFAAANVGGPSATWEKLKPWVIQFATMEHRRDRDADADEAAAAEKTLKEFNEGFKAQLGLEFEKELLPLLSGSLGCFLAKGGDDDDEPCFGVVLGAKDEAAAQKLLAAMKIKDGAIGRVGGGHERIFAARVGANVLLAPREEWIAKAVAAVAAGKTLAGAGAYEKTMKALGGEAGLMAFVQVGEAQKLLQGHDEKWLEPLSPDCLAAGVTLAPTGLTFRSTAPLEFAPLLAILPEFERVAAGMTRDACQRRLERIAEAAGQYAAKNQGRWPASFDDLGEAFKAGSSLRRCPADGKEYVFAALGVIPPKALERQYVLCHGAEGAHGSENVPVERPGREEKWQETCAALVAGGSAHVEQLHLHAGTLSARLVNDQSILALADPERLKVADEDKKKIAAAIADLGNENFEKREAATKALREAGPKSIPALLPLLTSKDMEVAERAEQLLKTLTGLAKREEILKLTGQEPEPGNERTPRLPRKPPPPVLVR